jgi:dihydrofolate synthase/folylpolyglutamate synthase
MSKKEEILNKLFSLQRFGIKPGLERTMNLSEYIGKPHKKFPSIHVAGTNGKGSVCSMLASILMEAGYSVGLYTSPHLVNFNERIKINGNNISDDEMVELAEKLMPGEKKWGCTFFEITTVMAFEYFARNNVDVAVIETGMGGRFDSTNILNPIISIITSIDFDHKVYLGNTLEEIAYEKAGIIKENTPTVISRYNNSVKKVFVDVANSKKSEIIESNDFCEVENCKYNPDFSQTFDIKTLKERIDNVNLPLAGKHQKENIKQVITATEILKKHYSISSDNITNGFKNILANTKIEGRVQLYQNDNLIILDTGHNPEAVKKLVETLKLHRPEIERWNFVYGAMEDKDIESILEIIKPICNDLIVTRPNIERAIDLDKLEGIAKELRFQKVIKFKDVGDAIKYSKELLHPFVISGSFYLAGEAIPVLEKMLKVHS